jgi:RNA polymerase sigma-70 factor, ECF subfamily
MSPSDADLIARVLARDDRHAFSTLVRRHQSAVRGLLRRLTCGNESQADDLAQETFWRAYRGLRGYRAGARLSTWLHRIAYNVFLNSIRRREPTGLEEPTAATPGGNHAMLRHDLAHALVDLAPAERAAITLAFGREHTHQEVAAILDCPLGTVKTHIARGKEKLRKRLGAWESRVAT